ncbi:MAG: DUF4384 domain-containing protein [Rhodocyclaceae bacterium]|nr:DUF4384 domain-containing protein [Rhodocyclaceae bacterium]
MADDTNDDTVHYSGQGAPEAAPVGGAAADAANGTAAYDPRTLRKGTRVGNYQITGVIGKGGFGIVYLARHVTLQREIALKEYMPRDLAMRMPDGTISAAASVAAEDEAGFQLGLKSFINEARLLAGFDHPSLAGVLDYWEANGTAYMVMPYYKGRSLRVYLEHMKDEGRFPPTEQWLRSVLDPILDALATLHAKGCFHRDVSPENIQLLDDGDRPVLLDFGAARMAIGGARQHMTAFLNPRYAPVEQYYEGQDDPTMLQGPWTDLYALGGVVFYALRGEKPQPSQSRLVMDRFNGLAAGLPAGAYSERFLSAFDKCLQVKPKDRPQSVAELRELLGKPGAPGVQQSGHPPAHAAQPRTAEPVLEAIPAPAMAAPSVAPEPAYGGALGLESRRETSNIGRTLLIGGGAAVALALGLVGYLVFSPGAAVKPTPAVAPAPATPSAPELPAAPGTPAPEKVATATPEVVAPPASVPPSPALPFAAVQSGASSDIPVDLKVARPTLRKGADTIEFTLTSPQSGFLYVYLRDEEGEVMRVFPNEFDSLNELKPGTPLTLPSPDWELKAPAAAGTMDLLAVVSASKRANPPGARRKNGQGAFLGFGRLENPSATELLGNLSCAAGTSCPGKYGAAVVKLQVE